MTLEQLKENIASKTSKQTLELLVEHLTEKNWEQLLADGGLEIATKQHDISNDYDYEIEIVID
ncbi:UNVERIFIED_CONTAM: hypothetical protein RF648_17945 [Kocuria sp. CPCC 205274]|uniref:Uncharacterized protein n=1 Tax=Herbiconiux daphne TaxID=2970914 RepID=A0ABT2HA79_9MICO|nr:hypothetical protein [Herbiconiux daphne]MCS5736865.1 hypothetical protein [Herbiconiux daphne]